MAPPITIDTLIVGAGFAGLYMLHKLRAAGIGATVVEAGSSVGGTWYWNRYPGARVDIQSLEYSFGFDDQLARDWRWSERYAPQPELLRYADHVADRFDLKRDIAFDTRVTTAHWDAAAGRSPPTPAPPMPRAISFSPPAACRFRLTSPFPASMTLPAPFIARRAGRMRASTSAGSVSGSSAPGRRRSSRSRSSPRPPQI